MNLFCKHNFVKDGDLIFCTKCGKQKKIECNHKWETLTQYEATYISGAGRDKSIILKQQCVKCGNIRSVEC
jgi:hypothetical protein